MIKFDDVGKGDGEGVEQTACHTCRRMLDYCCHVIQKENDKEASQRIRVWKNKLGGKKNMVLGSQRGRTTAQAHCHRALPSGSGEVAQWGGLCNQ